MLRVMQISKVADCISILTILKTTFEFRLKVQVFKPIQFRSMHTEMEALFHILHMQFTTLTFQAMV